MCLSVIQLTMRSRNSSGILGELEIVIGERARPAIAGVRERLRDALACRERGDMAGSIAAIRLAIRNWRRSAARSTRKRAPFADDRGTIRRTRSGAGQKGDAKSSVDVMRRKAGDTKDDDDKDW